MRVGWRLLTAFSVATFIYFFFSRPLGHPLLSPFTLMLLGILVAGRLVRLRPAIPARVPRAGRRARLLAAAAGSGSLVIVAGLGALVGASHLGPVTPATTPPQEAREAAAEPNCAGSGTAGERSGRTTSARHRPLPRVDAVAAGRDGGASVQVTLGPRSARDAGAFVACVEREAAGVFGHLFQQGRVDEVTVRAPAVLPNRRGTVVGLTLTVRAGSAARIDWEALQEDRGGARLICLVDSYALHPHLLPRHPLPDCPATSVP